MLVWGRTSAGLVAMFVSGAGSLLAQGILQRYIAVVTGGSDAFISTGISFAFIAGLALGAVVSGEIVRLWRQPAYWWSAVELACAVMLPFVMPLFLWIHHELIGLAGFGVADLGSYYAAVFALLLITCVPLAVTMGANYPAAFVTLVLGDKRQLARIAVLCLMVNTLGAAMGCALAVYLLPQYDLSKLILFAAGLYVLAGIIPLALRQRMPIELAESWLSRATPSANSTSVARSGVLLFISGFVGFSYQVLLFRHFNLVVPGPYWVFSIVLLFLLVSWGCGGLLALQARFRSAQVLICLAVSLAVALLALIYFGPDSDVIAASSTPTALTLWLPGVHRPVSIEAVAKLLPYLVVLFSPVVFSGWFFAAVHSETKTPEVRDLARLYALNLTGTFAGGITTTVLLPQIPALSFVFVPFMGFLVVVATLAITYAPRRLPSAWLAAWAAVIVISIISFAPSAGRLRLDYYRGLSKLRGFEKGDLLIAREDWSTSAWVVKDTFFVGGRVQAPDIFNACGGLRTEQMLFPGSIQNHGNILWVGIALGLGNGGLGVLLPESTIVNFDYSSALRYFWQNHRDWNFDLVGQRNNRAVIMDGRLALSLDKVFHDIIMEFTELEGVRGMSTIKSREFLAIAKKHLAQGGVFISLGWSANYAATLQGVFKNVWKMEGKPIFAATDGDLASLIASDPKAPRGKIRCIDDYLDGRKADNILVLLPRLQHRIITDAYPLADYGSLLEDIPAQDLTNRPLLHLPF